MPPWERGYLSFVLLLRGWVKNPYSKGSWQALDWSAGRREAMMEMVHDDA